MAASEVVAAVTMNERGHCILCVHVKAPTPLLLFIADLLTGARLALS